MVMVAMILLTSDCSKHGTLIGLVVNVIGYFLIAFETNFRMEGEIRPWVNVACGFNFSLPDVGCHGW